MLDHPSFFTVGSVDHSSSLLDDVMRELINGPLAAQQRFPTREDRFPGKPF
jgi:hypothetical protein